MPKSTPEAIRVKLGDMISKINADPEFRKKMEADGFALLDVKYKDMKGFMDEKAKGYIEAAKSAGVLK